ncbi:hypothetical protein HYH03_017238 [Edaphochlamys debaryana]|uniref:Uncharacterized protein n=1 Tax=Edaphochlamys debaryana TaxID=47281 RepID=A0A835XG12_9CHLO|nr:hypothetical protein HYH03_017238 [Edaphochlamys debaryana]|eukprot:KAG2483917.1 hypothetical protein HYH03_017238 [Edaphochlamys debaryana]
MAEASSPGNTIRATPLNNVAFVTRTGDEGPSTATARPVAGTQRAAVVPGFGEADAALEQPCTLKGLSSAVAAGVLGYIFGFVPSIFRHRSLKQLGTWHTEGLASTKAFAVMSGVYTTVQCLCERIRQQDDGVNRIIAGAASGAAVAYKSGWLGMLQSGILLGVVSYIFDFGTAPAKAAGLGQGCSSSGCSVSVGRLISCSRAGADGESQQDGDRRVAGRRLHLKLGSAHGPSRLLRGGPAAVLSTPVVMWMGPIVNQGYFTPPALSLGSA